MSSHGGIDDRILEAIIRSRDTVLNEVVLECPDLMWNQVFMAVDRLSREGVLTLTSKGHGIYRLRFSEQYGIKKVLEKI